MQKQRKIKNYNGSKLSFPRLVALHRLFRKSQLINKKKGYIFEATVPIHAGYLFLDLQESFEPDLS